MQETLLYLLQQTVIEEAWLSSVWYRCPLLQDWVLSMACHLIQADKWKSPVGPSFFFIVLKEKESNADEKFVGDSCPKPHYL